MSERGVRIQIDRLVLKGIAAEDRAALVSGLKAELARVLGSAKARDGLTQSSHTPVMRLATIPMERGSGGARTLGRNIGQGIGKRLR